MTHPAHITAFLGYLRETANGTTCRIAGFIRAHAGGQILFNLLLEVEPQLVVQLLFNERPSPQRSHPQSQLIRPAHHSYLKATIGSTREARETGTTMARQVTKSIMTAAPRMVTGSDDDTPNSWLATNRLAIIPAKTPETIPKPNNLNASFATSQITALGLEPSAMRMPISRVLRVTR